MEDGSVDSETDVRARAHSNFSVSNGYVSVDTMKRDTNRDGRKRRLTDDSESVESGYETTVPNGEPETETDE